MRRAGAGRWRWAALCAAAGFVLAASASLSGKRKEGGNDTTSSLFQLLDDTYGGKLEEYVLADVYADPASGEELRHVLRLDYDKSRAFGRLNLYVRGVGKMTPQQLSSYTPKQIYDFGEIDLEKFIKSAPGPFGQPGDLYLRSSDAGPLTRAPITDEARKQYDDLVTQYLIPALEKGHK
jgi:hypothetical protein